MTKTEKHKKFIGLSLLAYMISLRFVSDEVKQEYQPIIDYHKKLLKLKRISINHIVKLSQYCLDSSEKNVNLQKY